MPPEGLANVMISEGILNQGGCSDRVELRGRVVRIGGFDPAYTLGGDRGVFKWGDVGEVGDGKVVLVVGGYSIVDFRECGNGESLTKYLAEWLIREAKRVGVRVNDIAIDATSVQEVFCDFVDELSGGKVYRVKFGGNASERRIYGMSGDRYFSNRVSEIYGVMLEYILNGQVKGLSEEVMKELTRRQLKGTSNGKVMLESKVDYKKREGCSPDLADALGLMCIYMREGLGIDFGGGWGDRGVGSIMYLREGIGIGIDEGDGYGESDAEAEAIRRSAAWRLDMEGGDNGEVNTWDYI